MFEENVNFASHTYQLNSIHFKYNEKWKISCHELQFLYCILSRIPSFVSEFNLFSVGKFADRQYH